MLSGIRPAGLEEKKERVLLLRPFYIQLYIFRVSPKQSIEIIESHVLERATAKADDGMLNGYTLVAAAEEPEAGL